MASELKKVRVQIIDPISKLPQEDVDVLTSSASTYFPDGQSLQEKWDAGELKGDQGTPGTDGVAATIRVGEVTTVESSAEAAVTNVGTMNAAVLDFSLPKGEDGISPKILGRFDTYEALVAAYPDGSEIDGGFLVGPSGGPCDYYFWDKVHSKWDTLGMLQGEQGLKGDKGDPGLGLEIIAVFDTYDDMVATYPDGSVCEGKGCVTLVTPPGEYWFWSILTESWESIGVIKGEKGDIGPAPVFTIAQVNTIDYDQPASAFNNATDGNVELVLNIPRGAPGTGGGSGEHSATADGLNYNGKTYTVKDFRGKDTGFTNTVLNGVDVNTIKKEFTGFVVNATGLPSEISNTGFLEAQIVSAADYAAGGTDGVVVQRYTAFPGVQKLERIYYSGTWGAWKNVHTSATVNVANATADTEYNTSKVRYAAFGTTEPGYIQNGGIYYQY